MNRINLRKLSYLIFILILALLGNRCAVPSQELQGAPDKTSSKDYVHPLTQINLEKVFKENQGLKVFEENATMVHDYYRGGVQEKEEGETLMRESKWEEARIHLEKSSEFLRVVLKFLPDDEAHRNIYGDQVVIFLPNLLIADNDMKLITLYKNMGNQDKAAGAKSDGEYYLMESLKNVRTEWSDQIKKGLEDALSKQ